MYDLVIRNGLLVDGTGLPSFHADIGVADGKISRIARSISLGKREIDAEGLIVTPGFIDGHTHIDAQAHWDSLITCSSWHGVTSAVMGNCGFTLAPCRKGQEAFITRNLERAEDISGAAMRLGIDWRWETFPEYMEVIDALPKGINYAANIGHSALRTWAMGERAFDELATDDDISVMRSQVRAAIRCGAIGFTTSRSKNHRTSDDRPVASYIADWSELAILVEVLKEERTGVFEISMEDDARGIDPIKRAAALARMQHLSIATGVPLTFGLTVSGIDDPSLLREFFELLDSTARQGGRMFAQSHSKGIALLLSFETSLPFDVLPEWKEFRATSLEQQCALLRQPVTRRRLVAAAESAVYGEVFGGAPRAPNWRLLSVYNKPFPPYLSVAEIAERRGCSPLNAMIDVALEKNLKQFFIQPIREELSEQTLQIMSHPRTIMTFSDSGAHVSQISDCSVQTHLLGYWVRELSAFRLEEAVRMITLAPARAWNIPDRGMLREGMAADINVIDFDKISPDLPQLIHDLPGGGRRLIQSCSGIKATVVNGAILFENGIHSGALPGQLLRSRSCE